MTAPRITPDHPAVIRDSRGYDDPPTRHELWLEHEATTEEVAAWREAQAEGRRALREALDRFRSEDMEEEKAG